MNIKGSKEIIESISKKNGVSAAAVQELLDLQDEHVDLHVWGAKPALKRAIKKIVETELQKSV